MRRCLILSNNNFCSIGSRPWTASGIINVTSHGFASNSKSLIQKTQDVETSLEKIPATSDQDDIQIVKDILHSLERRRNVFSSALQTVSAMTPRSSQQRACSIHDYNAWCTTIQLPESSTSKSNFWTNISSLTRLDRKILGKDMSQLKGIFDDPLNARYLHTRAYTKAVAFCVRTNDFESLRWFMVHAQDNQVGSDINLANTMLGILVNIPSLQGWAAALATFAGLRLEADTSTWNQLLTLCNSQQKVLVYDRMKSLGVPEDAYTIGVMLPLEHDRYQTTTEYLCSTKHVPWTPRLGDILIGHLLSLRKSKNCVDLLQDTTFQVTVEAHNQVLSHLREVPSSKMSHQKIAKKICLALLRRSTSPNADTFLYLFKLSGVIRTEDYGDMIYKTASERGLVSRKLLYARREQLRRRRARSVVLSHPPMSWSSWVSGVEP